MEIFRNNFFPIPVAYFPEALLGIAETLACDTAKD